MHVKYFEINFSLEKLHLKNLIILQWFTQIKQYLFEINKNSPRLLQKVLIGQKVIIKP